MEYRRIPVASSPAGCFLYVLHFPNANHLQVGVGYESLNGLQVTHVKSSDIHQLHCNEIADIIEQSNDAPFHLKTGRLSPFFLGLDDVRLRTLRTPNPSDRAETLSAKLAQAIREVHHQVWGHPLDWEVEIVEIDDRLVWLTYDDTVGKIKIGIGFGGTDGVGALGDTAYAVGQRDVGAFVCKLWAGDLPLFFYGRPARWPLDLSPWIKPHADQQKIAKAILALADKVWEDLPVPRALTDAERQALLRTP